VNSVLCGLTSVSLGYTSRRKSVPLENHQHVFWSNCAMFPTLSAMHKCSSFSSSLPLFVNCHFLNSAILVGEKCISLWFWFAFFQWLMILDIFSSAFWLFVKKTHLIHLFIYLLLNWVVFLILTCKNWSGVLDSSPLLMKWFASTFSHFLDCLSLFVAVVLR
jgi:hypothetical protein